MRHPGTFHQARFLAKALYLIKISMMMDVVSESVVPMDKRHMAIGPKCEQKDSCNIWSKILNIILTISFKIDIKMTEIGQK